MKKILMAIAAVTIVFAILFSGCKKKSSEPNSGGGGGGDNGPCIDLYIGFTGFNDSIYNKPNSLVDDSWFETLETYYDGTSIPGHNDAYLYYSEYMALDNLLNLENEPEHLTNVSVITFTKALDYISLDSPVTNPEGYGSNAEYRDGLHNKIIGNQVFGKDINAYAIGLVNENVSSNIEEFRANLSALSSVPDNIYEVSTMDSVDIVLNELVETIKNATGEGNSNILMMVFDCSYNESRVKTIPHMVYTFVDNMVCGHIAYYKAPTVRTHQVGDVGRTWAVCGGDLLDWGHNWVLSKGLVYSYKTPNLDYYNWVTTGSVHYSTGPGDFPNVRMGFLKPDTDYYVAAYAINYVGISYGEVYTFHTLADGVPSVVTLPTSDVTETTADVCGAVVDDGGHDILERGICYGLSSDPDISGSHVVCADGDSLFCTTLTGLEPNTTYHYRAYAENEEGIGYGEDMQFTTLGNAGDEGAFSVGGRGVIIAPGNLQYNQGTHEWRFAENTWDYIGGANTGAGSPIYTGWIDLFGWGTGNEPSCIVDTSGYYLNFTDWGINPISNGGNTPYQWRTLSDTEWESILYNRETPSGIRFAMGQVNGVNGVILVPDQWNSSYYPLTHCNENAVLGDMPNVISASTWDSDLKPHGAVFLPCAGKRKFGDEYVDSNSWGAYWTSTEAEDVYGLGTDIIRMAWALIPSVYQGLGQGVDILSYERDYGASVRLVKDVGK